MSGGETFAGFPEGTFRFLEELAGHNTKAWFEAHRADYERYYIEPARAFVRAIGPRLQALSPGVGYDPRVNGSLFRINRDVRFSRDKTPYKTHLDLWFWEGEHRGWDNPGYFLRMFPERLLLGSGMHRFEKAQLAAYRGAVVDERSGAELAALLDRVRSTGPYEIGGSTRKTVPRGFDKAHVRVPLLLHEGLHATMETVMPAEARSAAFVDYCLAHFRATGPVNRWLLAHVCGARPA
jgi:uncharacterized protein (TIGR02453 family)